MSETDRAQEDTIRRAFSKVAGDDMEIDAYELKDILTAAYARGESRARNNVKGHDRNHQIDDIDYVLVQYEQ